MITFLLVVQFVLALLLTVVVLLQKSSSIGLGAYSGSNETMFGAKGPGTFLSKATFTLGFLFVVNTIALGYFYNSQHNRSVVDSFEASDLVPAAPKAPLAPESTPAAPVAPAAPTQPQ